jgi:hypothetical protein
MASFLRQEGGDGVEAREYEVSFSGGTCCHKTENR